MSSLSNGLIFNREVYLLIFEAYIIQEAANGAVTSSGSYDFEASRIIVSLKGIIDDGEIDT